MTDRRCTQYRAAHDAWGRACRTPLSVRSRSVARCSRLPRGDAIRQSEDCCDFSPPTPRWRTLSRSVVASNAAGIAQLERREFMVRRNLAEIFAMRVLMSVGDALPMIDTSISTELAEEALSHHNCGWRFDGNSVECGLSKASLDRLAGQ